MLQPQDQVTYCLSIMDAWDEKVCHFVAGRHHGWVLRQLGWVGQSGWLVCRPKNYPLPAIPASLKHTLADSPSGFELPFKIQS